MILLKNIYFPAFSRVTFQFQSPTIRMKSNIYTRSLHHYYTVNQPGKSFHPRYKLTRRKLKEV